MNLNCVSKYEVKRSDMDTDRQIGLLNSEAQIIIGVGLTSGCWLLGPLSKIGLWSGVFPEDSAIDDNG